MPGTGNEAGRAGEDRHRQVETQTEARTTERKTREGTKQALLIEMLERPKGATIDEIVSATGWQVTPRGVHGRGPQEETRPDHHIREGRDPRSRLSHQSELRDSLAEAEARSDAGFMRSVTAGR